MSKTDYVVDTLATRIASTLQDLGFVTENRKEWAREWGWKVDLIDLVPLYAGLTVNFYVYVPCRLTGNRPEFDELAMTGLGNYLGRARSAFRKRLFQSDSGFLQQLTYEMTSGLRWFDGYSTRSTSLRSLRHGDKNKESPSYKDCEQYLMHLPGDLEEMACLREGQRWR